MLNVDTKIHYLQFQLPGNSVYVDIAYVSKSKIPKSGYGLFAATNLPKNIPILIYMGREVKAPSKKRQYIMEMPSTYVRKKVDKTNGGLWGREGNPYTWMPCLLIQLKNGTSPSRCT